MADDDTPPDFETLLEYLKNSRGFDFTGYKRASLQRRIDRRMRSIDVESYDAYLDFLELHPDEFVSLFNAILINVTSFFRDIGSWAYLREEVLPERLEALDADGPIRAWSAGCASGQEAYSLAIILSDLLGADAFARRVKIYGTDIDEDALQLARQGAYTEGELNGLSEETRTKYFERYGERFAFRSDLRRSIIFGRLDVIHDAPISRLDLLLCRNTLMYFNAETQAQVLQRFHFGLNQGGVLMLGKAETLLSHNESFEPLDRKRRLFMRIQPRRELERLPEWTSYIGRTDGDDEPDVLSQYGLIFRTLPVPTLLLDRTSALLDFSDRAAQLLGLRPADRGNLLKDLDVSYKPVDLRSPVNQALSERATKHVHNIEMRSDGMALTFDIDVVPLFDHTDMRGVCLFFNDRTHERELEDRNQLSTLELEQAYQAVQSANEELETTNEELQSTIEELETTNEELQSTNEELETMNEELQSTNDELHTVNEEVRERGDEVDQLNSFLEAILTSLRGGVIVVDSDRHILVWNPHATELWGVREDEVLGADLLTIDIGLPVNVLATPLDRVLRGKSDSEELTVDAVTRRGRAAQSRVTITSLKQMRNRGAILVMEVVLSDDTYA